MATHWKRLRPVSPWGNTYFLIEHSFCLLLGCPASWYNGAISLWPCQTSIHGYHSPAITLLWKHHSAWESSLKTLLHWKNTHFFIKFWTFETNSLFVPRISRMRWGRGRDQLVDIKWLMAKVLLLFSQVNPQTSAHPLKTHSPFPTPLLTQYIQLLLYPLSYVESFYLDVNFTYQTGNSQKRPLLIHLCFSSLWARSGLITA